MKAAEYGGLSAQIFTCLVKNKKRSLCWPGSPPIPGALALISFTGATCVKGFSVGSPLPGRKHECSATTKRPDQNVCPLNLAVSSSSDKSSSSCCSRVRRRFLRLRATARDQARLNFPAPVPTFCTGRTNCAELRARASPLRASRQAAINLHHLSANPSGHPVTRGSIFCAPGAKYTMCEASFTSGWNCRLRVVQKNLPARKIGPTREFNRPPYDSHSPSCGEAPR